MMNQQSTLSREHQKLILEQKKSNRNKVFDLRRRHQANSSNKQIPTYLMAFNDPLRKAIIESLNEPVPNLLPQLKTETISYYRRSSKPKFFPEQNGFSNPHIIYESLWMLTTAEKTDYPNFDEIKDYFEQHLQSYLTNENAEIVEMATIVAGNHVLGRVEDILPMVQKERFWVFANHIIEGRIDISHLFKEILKDNVSALQLLYQISNSKQTNNNKQIQEQKPWNIKDVIIEGLFSNQNQEVLENIVDNMSYSNPVCNLCLKIVGNLLTDDDHIDKLLNKGVIDYLSKLLDADKKKVREHACWVLSNIASGQPHQSQALFRNLPLMARLMSLLDSDVLAVKTEIMHVVAGILESAVLWKEWYDIFLTLLSPQKLDLPGILSRFIDQKYAPLQHITIVVIERIKKLVINKMDELEAEAYMKNLDRYGLGKLTSLSITEIEEQHH